MRARLVNQVSAIALAALGTFGIAAANSAHAIVFTFDNVKNGSGTTVVTGLTDTSLNTDITNYMNAVVKLANPAYGAVSLVDSTKGGEGETNYTGDNHVVGPTVGAGKQLTSCSGCVMMSNGVVPLTLGNTDGFVENGTSSGTAQLNNANPYSANGKVGHLTTFDAYVTNDVNNSNPDKTTLAFQFSGGLTFNTIEFDYEIFPDGSGITPDMTVKYKGADNLMHTVSGTPIVGETPDGDTHSPSSGQTTVEASLQLLSHASFTLPESTSEIWFVDWPPTIGIDNLYIGYVPPPPRINTPEPGTLTLFALGLAGIGIPAWRRRQKARASI